MAWFIKGGQLLEKVGSRGTGSREEKSKRNEREDQAFSAACTSPSIPQPFHLGGGRSVWDVLPTNTIMGAEARE